MVKSRIAKSLKFKTGLVLTGCALLLTALSGCEVAGVLLHVAVGEPPINAQYVPPKEPTLIMVENYRSPDIARFDSDQIAHQVGSELKKQANMDVVSPDKIEEMREDDAHAYRQMKIAAVGKAADAKVVIYVDLVESGVTQDASAGAVHAVATARVSVIDTKSGQTLWPPDSAHGKEVSQTMEFDQYDEDRAVAMHNQLLTKLSSKIAKLFYTWKAEDQDQENAGG
jgi:hypothetical protein